MTTDRRYAVDIPGWNFTTGMPTEAMICVSDQFQTQVEAIRFTQQHFGADAEGCICLVSAYGGEPADDDDDFWDEPLSVPFDPDNAKLEKFKQIRQLHDELGTDEFLELLQQSFAYASRDRTDRITKMYGHIANTLTRLCSEIV